jgi:hypothetical protein
MAEAIAEIGLEEALASPPEGPLSEWQVLELLAQMSAANPSPGSGAAAALALGMAGACVAKALALSALHSGDGQLAGGADQARILTMMALEAAQRDGDDFRAWLKDHSAKSLVDLAQDADAIEDVAARLLSLLLANKDAVPSHLRPDLDAALDLISASEAIVKRNLASNQSSQQRH